MYRRSNRMGNRSLVRALIIFAAMSLIASACSRTPTEESEAVADRTPAPGETPSAIDEDDEETLDVDEDPADPDAPRPRARIGDTTETEDEEPSPEDPGPAGPPVADIFTADEDRIGISDDEIRICMHAAFVFGDIFDNSPEDERVYWQMINDAGGIHGRQVNIRFEDDQYSPDQALRAAEACKDWGTFLTLSGVGFDQIPAVREWAEEHRQLYFHSMATEDGAHDKRFSFAIAPTLQTMGTQIAQFLATEHSDKQFAAVSRRSPNWDGALDAWEAELANQGMEPEAVHRVDQNQTTYGSEILDLRTSCPQDDCVVFVNLNVVEFSQLYQQARGQGYRPQWFNYGFQLVNDVLGSDAAADPPVQAWYVTPAFDLYNETNQPWWDEIQRMKEAYEQYRPQKELNDVDWMFWLTFKAMHRMFEDCGPDCTRNRFYGMLQDGYKATVDPLCEADFGRGHSNFGSWRGNIFESVTHSQYGAVWQQTHTCKLGF